MRTVWKIVLDQPLIHSLYIYVYIYMDIYVCAYVYTSFYTDKPVYIYINIYSILCNKL